MTLMNEMVEAQLNAGQANLTDRIMVQNINDDLGKRNAFLGPDLQDALDNMAEVIRRPKRSPDFVEGVDYRVVFRLRDGVVYLPDDLLKKACDWLFWNPCLYTYRGFSSAGADTFDPGELEALQALVNTMTYNHYSVCYIEVAPGKVLAPFYSSYNGDRIAAGLVTKGILKQFVF